jgi:hypothetical protein
MGESETSACASGASNERVKTTGEMRRESFIVSDNNPEGLSVLEKH